MRNVGAVAESPAAGEAVDGARWIRYDRSVLGAFAGHPAYHRHWADPAGPDDRVAVYTVAACELNEVRRYVADRSVQPHFDPHSLQLEARVFGEALVELGRLDEARAQLAWLERLGAKDEARVLRGALEAAAAKAVTPVSAPAADAPSDSSASK